jgi:hypothetical protein
MFHKLLSFGEQVLAAVQHTFSPPRNASSREVRVNGALCLLAAFLVLVAAGLLMVVMSALMPARSQAVMAVLIAPAMLFYALSIFGGYRLLVGKTPEPAYPGEVSFKRVAYGISSVLMMFALVLGLAAILDYFLE